MLKENFLTTKRYTYVDVDLLSKIEIKNVGPFDGEGISIDFKPLTIIMGANNTGKSSILYSFDICRTNQFPPFVFKINDNISLAQYMRDPANKGQIDLTANFDANEIRKITELEYLRPPHPQGRTLKFTVFIDNKISMQDSVYTHTSTLIEGKVLGRFNEFVNNATFLLADRTFVPSQAMVGASGQKILPNGGNTIEFLLERWTDQDKRWPELVYWLQKIDVNVTQLKTPLRGNLVSIETRRTYGNNELDVNIFQQGSGIHRAIQIISALVFSPPGSLIIIEEPEMNLHKGAQEVIADLINKSINERGMQVIITTHSFDFLLPYISDIGMGKARGNDHIKISKDKVQLVELSINNGKIIAKQNIKGKFTTIRDELKAILG